MLHDSATVSGVTEACKYNDHSVCNNPHCACDCHVKARHEAQVQVSPPSETGPEKSCPKCGVKRPAYENHCRIDGTRLSSLLCNLCGAVREPEDKFCHGCGGPADAVGEVKLPQVVNIPTVPPVDNGVDYGRSILKQMQEELGDVSQPEEGVAYVVEQPGGQQGSFKLVSRPNPNRIRVPAGGPSGRVPQQPRVAQASPPSPSQGRSFKLPIKPS